MIREVYRALQSSDTHPSVNDGLKKDFADSDTLMMRLLLIHWAVAATLMGYAHGFYLMGFIGGGIICTIGYAGVKLVPTSEYSRMVLAVCLMLFSALFIQQNLGRIEIHFHIFAAMAFLIRYKDIKPLLAAVVTIAAHHLAFNYCQQFGVTLFGQELTIFSYGYGLDIVILHAAFVIFEAAFLITIILQLRAQFRQSILISTSTQEALTSLDKVIKTKDVSNRLEDTHDHAPIVNSLLDWMNKNIAIHEAVDNTSGCLMIVDESACIIECNKSAEKLFKILSPDYLTMDIRYTASNMKGISLYEIYPSGNFTLDIKTLDNPITNELEIGSRKLQVTINPVIKDSGERLGAVIEWSDHTEQLSIEAEIQQIVDAASRGNLSCRIPLDSKQGFYARSAVGMNRLLDEIQEVINESSIVLGALSLGDLTKRVNSEYDGDFGLLKNDLNNTIDTLTSIVMNIRNTSHSVSNSAQTIMGDLGDLSSSAEQQSTSLTESVANISQLTESVKNNADSASDASLLVEDAKTRANRGGEVIQHAVSAMSEISESSSKIGNIIDVIDDIAFQTNLLALNASVESARAGEHGRGFAVVASEVRNLAGRSAVAAGEIKSLIEDSTKKVGEGSRLVNESGQTLEEIVLSVNKVSNIMENITSANNIQSDRISQVNSAIKKISEVTQENSSLVEGANVSSKKMRDKADKLFEQVRIFNTGDSGTPVPALRKAS